MTMTVTQRTELHSLRKALHALEEVQYLTRPRLTVAEAEAQMDDYDDHLRALLEKTQAAIRILENADA